MTYKLKKAFTMIELVFVIAVIGILSSFMLPSLTSMIPGMSSEGKLREAAVQVMSHIRYTQHLAMIDNRFDKENEVWFKERWQIRFYENVNSELEWAYTIFSDRTNQDLEPNINEIARNPINTNEYMTGGYPGNVIDVNNSRRTEKMKLNNNYGVQDIDFSNSCTSFNSRKIIFDNFGRPYWRYDDDDTDYDVNLLYTACQIDICSVPDCTIANANDIVSIVIEPMTGYTHFQ
jgi:prepilin-type N-terminal cleavage/methylation domain-containing protein